jgi:hypothetical protein
MMEDSSRMEACAIAGPWVLYDLEVAKSAIFIPAGREDHSNRGEAWRKPCTLLYNALHHFASLGIPVRRLMTDNGSTYRSKIHRF